LKREHGPFGPPGYAYEIKREGDCAFRTATISFANLKIHNPQNRTKNWKPMIKTQKILIETLAFSSKINVW